MHAFVWGVMQWCNNQEFMVCCKLKVMSIILQVIWGTHKLVAECCPPARCFGLSHFSAMYTMYSSWQINSLHVTLSYIHSYDRLDSAPFIQAANHITSKITNLSILSSTNKLRKDKKNGSALMINDIINLKCHSKSLKRRLHRYAPKVFLSFSSVLENNY